MTAMVPVSSVATLFIGHLFAAAALGFWSAQVVSCVLNAVAAGAVGLVALLLWRGMRQCAAEQRSAAASRRSSPDPRMDAFDSPVPKAGPVADGSSRDDSGRGNPLAVAARDTASLFEPGVLLDTAPAEGFQSFPRDAMLASGQESRTSVALDPAELMGSSSVPAANRYPTQPSMALHSCSTSVTTNDSGTSRTVEAAAVAAGAAGTSGGVPIVVAPQGFGADRPSVTPLASPSGGAPPPEPLITSLVITVRQSPTVAPPQAFNGREVDSAAAATEADIEGGTAALNRSGRPTKRAIVFAPSRRGTSVKRDSSNSSSVLATPDRPASPIMATPRAAVSATPPAATESMIVNVDDERSGRFNSEAPDDDDEAPPRRESLGLKLVTAVAWVASIAAVVETAFALEQPAVLAWLYVLHPLASPYYSAWSLVSMVLQLAAGLTIVIRRGDGGGSNDTKAAETAARCIEAVFVLGLGFHTATLWAALARTGRHRFSAGGGNAGPSGDESGHSSPRPFGNAAGRTASEDATDAGSGGDRRDPPGQGARRNVSKHNNINKCNSNQSGHWEPLSFVGQSGSAFAEIRGRGGALRSGYGKRGGGDETEPATLAEATDVILEAMAIGALDIAAERINEMPAAHAPRQSLLFQVLHRIQTMTSYAPLDMSSPVPSTTQFQFSKSGIDLKLDSVVKATALHRKSMADLNPRNEDDLSSISSSEDDGDDAEPGDGFRGLAGGSTSESFRKQTAAMTRLTSGASLLDQGGSTSGLPTSPPSFSFGRIALPAAASDRCSALGSNGILSVSTRHLTLAAALGDRGSVHGDRGDRRGSAQGDRSSLQAASPAPLTAATRHGTVLIASFAPPTRQSQLTAADVRLGFQRLLELCEEVLSNSRATMLPSADDTIVVVWGASSFVSDSAPIAVHCGMSLAGLAESRGIGEVRVGISHGTIHSGTLGPPQFRSLRVLGEPVAKATALMRLATRLRLSCIVCDRCRDRCLATHVTRPVEFVRFSEPELGRVVSEVVGVQQGVEMGEWMYQMQKMKLLRLGDSISVSGVAGENEPLWELAFDAFMREDLVQALMLLERHIRRHPEDAYAAVFRSRIERTQLTGAGNLAARVWNFW